MQLTLFLLAEWLTGIGCQRMLQFSDRESAFGVLLKRNKDWARMNGYTYILESKKKWSKTHSIYFEKIRMLLESLDDPATKWVLWVDDDATINRPELTVQYWLDAYPNADFILSPQGNLELHGVTLEHYYNTGVWIARNTQWSKDVLQSLRRNTNICHDLQVVERVGNPEQDCLVRLVYGLSEGTYPNFTSFDGHKPLPQMLHRIGEPHHSSFNCVGSNSEFNCFPWIFHFQHGAKADVSRVFLPQLQFGASTAALDQRNIDQPLSYRRHQTPCSVVVVPTHGFANRLRMMASAYIYAEEYDCEYRVLWETEPAMPHDWYDLFRISITKPKPVDDARRLRPEHIVHSNLWVDDINPFARQPAVVFRGGHTFKISAMSVAQYNHRKQSFYRLLAASKRGHALNASGFICVHYRHATAMYDAMDDIKFQEISPLSAFKTRLMTEQNGTDESRKPLFIASTSRKMKMEIASWNPSRDVVFWDRENQADTNGRGGGINGLRELIFDWFTLASCDLILGSHGSSFSDEAAHVFGSVKECIGFVESEYHTYSEIGSNMTRFVKGYQEQS